MDREVALGVLREAMDTWRARSYAQLVERVEQEPEVREVTGPDGKKYQLVRSAQHDSDRLVAYMLCDA